MTVGIQQLMWRISGVRDAFHAAVYADRDVDAALAAVTSDCVLVNLPAGTGARGEEELRGYLADEVLPHLPDDLCFERVSRTVDQRRVVEESTVCFTHDREMPWLLPGVAPTHRRAAALAISVVGFRHTTKLGTTTSLIATHRTLFDQAGLLAQLRPDAVQLTVAR